MKDSTILKKARKLIADKGHCKGELARNKYRHKVDPTSLSAVRFCAFGAIYNVLGIPDDPGVTCWNNEGMRRVNDVSRWLKDEIPYIEGLSFVTVDDYNDLDETTPKDVDNWFARAIKRAKNTESYV